MNEAPVSGFGRDVGTKTTMRITYPEGAIQKPERYEKDSLFVFSAFKPLDFKWLRQMVFKEKLVMPNSLLTFMRCYIQCTVTPVNKVILMLLGSLHCSEGGILT